MTAPHWRFDEPHDLLAEFAAGVTGKVRVVRDPSEGTDFAVKSLRPELTAGPEAVSALTESLDAVRRLDHPGAVVVDQVVEHDNQVVLIMRPVAGEDLGSLLTRRGRLESVEAVVIVAQLCDVLDAAHAAGIVHGDVKPSNVLLERAEQADGPVVVRLSDFGMAALVERAKGAGAAGNLVLPAEYRAPEFGAGGGADSGVSSGATTASDVYAAGVVLYQTLAGQPPFRGTDSEAIARLHRESRPERISGIPDSLWLLMTGCLDKRPEFRPTAPALARVLRELVPELEEVDLAANPAPDPVSEPEPEPEPEPVTEREREQPIQTAPTAALPVIRVPMDEQASPELPTVLPLADVQPSSEPPVVLPLADVQPSAELPVVRPPADMQPASALPAVLAPAAAELAKRTPKAKPGSDPSPVVRRAPGLTPVRAEAVAARMAELTAPPRSGGRAADPTLRLPAVVATADPVLASSRSSAGRSGPGRGDPGAPDPRRSDPHSSGPRSSDPEPPRKKSRRVLTSAVVGVFIVGVLVGGYFAMGYPGRHGAVADPGAAPTELAVGQTGGGTSVLIASLTPMPSSTGSASASSSATASASASAAAVVVGRSAVRTVTSTAPTTAKTTTAKATAVASPTTGLITGVDGECLDDANDRTVVNNQIDLYKCNGSEAQVWTVVPADNSLQVRNMCMEVLDGSTSSGSTIVIDTCDASAGQVFIPRANGEVYNPNSGDCLTDPGGSTQLGVIMEIQACTGGAGQVWTMPS